MYFPSALVALCIISLFSLSLAQTTSTTCYNDLESSSTFIAEVSQPYYNPYPCSLSADNIAYDASAQTHTFSIASSSSAGTTCGAMISQDVVSYGYYECQMQPPGISGTVTSCMVVSTVDAYYESVFIKFIGNDTARVYIGFYSVGQPHQAGPYTLGFDATAELHRYAFEWTSGYIIWYVDGKDVSSQMGNEPIPTTPNYFVANLVTEVTGGVLSDSSYVPTDASVDRNFQANLTSSSIQAVFKNISYTPVATISCDQTGVTPGGGGGGYNPLACDLRKPFAIYQDSLADGWTNADSTISNFSSTIAVHTGTTAISWDVIPNARLYLISPTTFPSTNYYSIEFWIYGNGVNGAQIGVYMLYNDGTPSLAVNVDLVLTEGVQPWDWSRAVIPFTMFGNAANVSRNVKGFYLAAIGTSFGGRVLIDDIYLGYQYPMCENKTSVIYSDGLASGYSDYSWGVWTLQSTQTAYSGSYSVEWELYGSSGIHFHGDGVDSGTFQGISFWINTGQLAGWQWTVAMTSDGSTAANSQVGTPIELFMYYGGIMPQQDGQWTHIVIPFYEFGITPGTSLNGIIFNLETSNYQGILYIDQIEYIEETSPSTSGAARSAGLCAGIVALVALAVFTFSLI